MRESPPPEDANVVPFRAGNPRSAEVRVPAAPVLAAGITRAAWLTPDGEIDEMRLSEAGQRAASEPPIVVHAPATARRLGLDRLACYDALELFAFVRPAKFCLPTPRGLAEATGQPSPHGLAAESRVGPGVPIASAAAGVAGAVAVAGEMGRLVASIVNIPSRT